MAPATATDDVGILTIANGTSFTFTDPFYGSGTFMRVTFSDTQITLTNLVPGLHPNYTAASFTFSAARRCCAPAARRWRSMASSSLQWRR